MAAFVLFTTTTRAGRIPAGHRVSLFLLTACRPCHRRAIAPIDEIERIVKLAVDGVGIKRGYMINGNPSRRKTLDAIAVHDRSAAVPDEVFDAFCAATIGDPP